MRFSCARPLKSLFASIVCLALSLVLASPAFATGGEILEGKIVDQLDLQAIGSATDKTENGAYKLENTIVINKELEIGTLTYITGPFAGGFDGQSYSIVGLSKPLFDQVTSSAPGSIDQIRDLTLQAADSPGAVGNGLLANILGENVGITGIHVFGALTQQGVDGVGGLVGQNFGGIYNSTSDINVHAARACGDVCVGGGIVGGLVGINESTGTIQNSVSFGGVSGDEAAIGGLVGRNLGSIQNSSSGAVVVGSDFVGGLAGENVGTVVGGTATGSVDSTGIAVGGLLGYNGGSVELSWARGNVHGIREVGGLVGKSIGTIQASASSGVVTGDVFSVGGLVGLNTGDIHTSSSQGTVTGGLFNIGGLVGTNEGSISNSIAFGSVSGVSGSSYVGGLVGSNGNWFNLNPGQIHYSIASGVVECACSYVGGLVGQNVYSSLIESSFASGNVAGQGFTGGFAGSNSDLSTITQSRSIGNVSGADDFVGGFVGKNQSTISTSMAEGNIVSTLNFVGGFVGDNSNNGNIQDSFATGRVTGVDAVGGFAGNNDGTLTRSGSKSTIVGTNYVGGFAGQNSGAIYKSGFSVGTIRGRYVVGGFAGQNSGLIQDSAAFGQESGTSNDLVGNLGSDPMDPNFGLYGNVGLLIGRNADYTCCGSLRHADVNSSWSSVVAVDALDPLIAYKNQIGFSDGYCDSHCSFSSPTNIGPQAQVGTSDGIDLLNTNLIGSAWSQDVYPNRYINSGLPYISGLLPRKFYSYKTPEITEKRNYFRIYREQIPTAENKQAAASKNVLEFIGGRGPQPKLADFRDLGISGVTIANLPILLKLLKNLAVTSLDPELIAKQIKIANALLAKQKKAKQGLKIKKASFESSSWTGFIPSLLLG